MGINLDQGSHEGVDQPPKVLSGVLVLVFVLPIVPVILLPIFPVIVKSLYVIYVFCQIVYLLFDVYSLIPCSG